MALTGQCAPIRAFLLNIMCDPDPDVCRNYMNGAICSLSILGSSISFTSCNFVFVNESGASISKMEENMD